MDQYNNQSKGGVSDDGLSEQPTMLVRKDAFNQPPPEEPVQAPQPPLDDYAPTIRRSALPVEEPAPVLPPTPAPEIPPPSPTPYYPQPMNNPPPPPAPVAPPPQKSKKNTWLIVLIIVLVVICCCCVLLFAVPTLMGGAVNDVFGNVMEGLGGY